MSNDKRPTADSGRRPLSRAVLLLASFVAVACVTVASLPRVLPSLPAFADTPLTQSSPITDAEPSEMQLYIEQTAHEYSAATERVAELEAEAQQCRDRIAQIEAELPAAADSACDSMRAHYKYTQGAGGLIDLILSSDNFSSFVSMVAYLNGVEEYHADRISSYVALKEELTAQQAELETALEEARIEQQHAEAALAEAQAARVEAQRLAAERARMEAEAAAAAANAPQEQGDASLGSQDTASEQASSDTSQQHSASEPTISDSGVAIQDTTDPATQVEAAVEEQVATEPEPEPEPDPVASDNVDWTSEPNSFVVEWGARIDSYLAGSPLAGYGPTFAAAAWEYGVDPRWSPAISCIESGKGAVCFLPYNAWGWGSVSWGSWEEAIYSHVAGLAAGYGYTISYEAAQRYCPPTADEWYSAVLGQMESI